MSGEPTAKSGNQASALSPQEAALAKVMKACFDGTIGSGILVDGKKGPEPTQEQKLACASHMLAQANVAPVSHDAILNIAKAIEGGSAKGQGPRR